MPHLQGGWFKPVTLAIAAIPIIAFGAYDTDLAFPLFGDVQIPLLYIGLVLLMIPITGNTINSIDVLNGVASGFMVIASFSLSICLFIVQNYEIAIVSLPLGFVSLAFYKYHKIPSRIFPGDSGALTLGAMYGTIAIIGGVEIIAAVALLPAVINSFLFLSSVKKIVEHRQIKGKPVEHTEDFKLKATDDKTAPVTLVRLLLAGGPLSEKQIGFAIFKLGIFSGILAVITAFMMGVSL
ncbi:UDP-N-acetylglucosamine--dolichyl-phosphate N-acetylglucosaminephosphotransferase protein [Marine Group I thaumarchaeote SCGC AAA799-B03]|uniref:UDP-N-acetylglucosamine--dolichyl-phosphate N-acetylglucosaminephosphotransferase protein n=1 Tax=Marine Group I thaumarchaeote SCGC AAA799-B03 TaxID=1502289 RepID=A0A087S777_9ARCH|nr:UDP-N-acetylglucosamine--dolichyl-phosphate N-acetylglucosaminephosphotransferase protein [Marine Group I thaumarchaeote SCGC AAA799-B03]